MRFMKEDEAIKAMGLFEGAKDNERISKTALKNWVVVILSALAVDCLISS